MSDDRLGVLIMAGGTGGHIFPGLAVAEALRRRQVTVRWLGARGAMESQRVPAADIPFDAVDISGLRGKGLSRWIGAPFELARAVGQAFSILGRHRPRCAVSFGGYAAGPGSIAARLRGIPLLIHEQNRAPGLTNRMLAPFAAEILEGFPSSWRGRRPVITCGNPVRQDVAGLPPPAVRWAERTGPLRLLVTGGSQGARALNQALPAAIAALPAARRPLVRHQAGSREVASTRASYAAAGVEAEVETFIDDMAAAYAWADLVVCRCGALTVAELAAAGVGSVLVPFPHAVDDHQARNAAFLADAGAARMVREDPGFPQRLAAELSGLLTERARLLPLAQAARACALPGAAECVADRCMVYVAA